MTVTDLTLVTRVDDFRKHIFDLIIIKYKELNQKLNAPTKSQLKYMYEMTKNHDLTNLIIFF